MNGDLYGSLHSSSPTHPLKISCEAAKKRRNRTLRIVGELPDMRREKVNLVRQAVTENRRAYVLVNNRAEGNAPLTVEALVAQLAT